MAEKKRKTGENRIGNKDIITEENKKGEGSHNTKKILIALTSLILIGLGVGGGYYFYLMSPLAITSTAKPQTPVITSLVPADSHVSLPIDNLTPINIINTVRAEMAKIQPNNTIKEIVPIQTNNAQKFRLNSTDMINTMDINAPDILKRSLSNDWMLGVYADNQGAKTVFIVADIDYFQNAFAGMLQWESVMPDDLKQYLFTNTPADISSTPLLNTPIPANTVSSTTGTTTATTSISSSTPPTSYQNSPTYNVFHGSFIDKIINNKDVREFQTNGQLVFLYSFIDNNNKLIITGSESALSEVLNRLEQNAFVR